MSFAKSPTSWLGGLFFAAMLTSCASHHANPSASWSSNRQYVENSCTDISGVYQNIGEDAPDNKQKEIHERHPQYLSGYFEPSVLINGIKHKWITRVEISFIPKGELIVDLIKRNKTVGTRILKQEKDFSCTTEGIVMKSSYSPSSPFGPSVNLYTRLLYKAEDGSLIVKDREREVGLFAVIPTWSSVTQFYRFPPLDERP